MKSKAKILIVEDKSIIYKRLQLVLSENQYETLDYCPSVKDAIHSINLERPDLVLLDIDLQGEHDGIYLGSLLKEEYKTPFIYVTDYEDEETFHRLKETLPSAYISKSDINLHEESEFIIPTKPHLDEKKLIRAIQLELERNRNKIIYPIIKDAIIAYVDYVQQTNNLGSADLKRVPVNYSDIVYFTTNSELIDDIKSKEKKKKVYKKIKRNNTRIYTVEKKSFILPSNLTPILKILPNNFVRISEDYIVNINSKMFDGRINGSRLSFFDQSLVVSETYKNELEKRLALFYDSV